MEPLEQWGATDELIPRDLSSTLSTVEIEASVNLPFSLDNWILRAFYALPYISLDH